MNDPDTAGAGSFSRRTFLKGLGTSAVAAVAAQTTAVAAELEKVNAERILGPGAVPVTLKVNGEKMKLQLEPRVTLLDALRDQLGITGAKRVCDRGECGACTVLLDGKAVYACSVLAIEAQGKPVATVESFMQGEDLHPIQQAMIDNDASQCGFCTPGFVVALKAGLYKNPNASPEEIQHALSGNLCRCGTYHGTQMAIAQMTQRKG